MNAKRRWTMRDRRGRFAALVLLCASLALAACAASSNAAAQASREAPEPPPTPPSNPRRISDAWSEESAPTSLSPSEVWRRLLAAALRAEPILPEDVEAMFGVPAQYAAPSTNLRLLTGGQATNYPVYFYRRWRCEQVEIRLLAQGLCSVGAEILELSVHGRFVAGDRGSARRCPLNSEVIAELAQYGWVLPRRSEYVSSARTGIPEPWAPPEQLERPAKRVLLEPPLVTGNNCLRSLQIISVVRGQ